MISYIQAIILGALQGITELFPISSLGHSVILPNVLQWNIDQHSNFFLIFLVATHLATALVLFGFFFKDWVHIFKGIMRSIKLRKIDDADTYAKLGWLIIVASIPAGILGLLLEEKLKTLFASPKIVAVFLIANGFLLYGAEFLRKRHAQKEVRNTNADNAVDAKIAQMTWARAVKVGCAQCLALIPGFSRTGSTIGGGLLERLDHEQSVRFSFLLATPIIFAASVLKLPELLHADTKTIVGPIVIGAIASAIAAYFSVRFLTRYFKTKTLKPFAAYCIGAGIFVLAVLFLR